MGYETIQFEVEKNVALLTLNRPEKLNSFTAQMNKEILQACREVAKREDIRALLISGAGKAFCAGEDLGSVSSGLPINHGDVLRERYNPMMLALHQLEKPVVAAVNGAAAGAGMSLALACDFRLASTTASFLEAFVHIGLVPDSGSCYYLPRIVGWAKALELAILGEKISANQAYELGLVTRVVEPEQLMVEAKLFAERLAQMPTTAIGLIKKTMLQGQQSSFEATLEAEGYAQELAGKTRDHQEGVAAFLAKRRPVFQGH